MIDEKQRAVLIDLGMCLRVPYEVIQLQRDINGAIIERIVEVTDLQTARARGAEPIDCELVGESLSDNCLRYRRCLIEPQGQCGKRPYMAPEVYENMKPFDGEAVDVWTAGTLLLFLLGSRRPYGIAHAGDIQFRNITTNIEQVLKKWKVVVSADCLDLLKNMLQVHPKSRFTLQEVLDHTWLQDPTEEYFYPTPDPYW